MRYDAFPIVHFCCSNCALVYAATQERRAERRLGAFFCGECATLVHEWTGRYNFINWKPVMRSKGHQHRVW